MIYSHDKTPLPRNSHTSVVAGDNLYILGGQDDENNKLDDLWELNLKTQALTQIDYKSPGDYSVGRSGHTAVVFANKMFVFGGILEVTKELNDLISFDFKTQTFSVIEQNGESESPYHSRFDDSNANTLHAPNKYGTNQYDSNSPNARARRYNASPSKKMS